MSEMHWTDRSPEDFLYSIASDFVEQLRAKMKTLGMSQSKLARVARVSKSYVSQVFNDPGNLSLITIVKFAKAVEMRVSLVGYEATEDELRGPINSEVFRLCWERQGKPIDMWSFKEQNVAATPNTVDVNALMANLAWGSEVFLKACELKTPMLPVDQLPMFVNKRSEVTSTGGKYTGWAKTLGGY